MGVGLGRCEDKALKIDITIPSKVLAQVDDYAKSHGLSRSRFLVQAAKRPLSAESGGLLTVR